MPPTTQRPARLDLNPSSAERWKNCTSSPGFLLANADKLPPSGSKFSDEGTTAHEVASAYLLDREPRASECPTPIDEDMLWHAYNYAEYVTALREQGSGLLVEQKMPLWYMPGRNAIVDAAVINPKSLHVIDYKYGEGVAVSPERNLQATIYAMNIAGPRKLKGNFPITVHIYQPRGRNSVDSPAHVWETTWEEIYGIALELELAARLIQDVAEGKRSPDLLTFAPSEKACQWCPAKGFCGARQEALTREIDVFDDLTVIPPASTLSVEQIAKILDRKKELVKFFNDVEEFALQHLTAGGTIPGYKRVMSRGGNRYWTNPVRAAKLLIESTLLRRDEVIEEKTISVASVEKLLGKGKIPADISELIAKPAGVPEVAPESDKREALGNVLDEFDQISPQN